MIPRRLSLCLLAVCSLAALPLFAAPPTTPAAMTKRVDELINARLAADKIPAAEAASDAEFLRRATLDLTGRIPRTSDTREFLSSSQPDRRTKLIDELLAKPTHSTHLANTWRRVLLPDSADVTRFGGDRGFEFWLRKQFADNAPYDQLAREVLLAKGTATQGPTLFYTSLENKPEQLAGATARVFLGVQIECAQCHDHPHDKWTQDDFWSYAAFFARLGQQGQNNQANAFNIADSEKGEVENPKTKQIAPPRFLNKAPLADDAKLSRREQLALWTVSQQNPYFAKAAVNRVWAMLFGRGLVEPVDDLGDHNPPSHPELMQELAEYFAATKYDIRNLVRVLANTDAYQRTSQLRDGETPTPLASFARMPLRTLTAEQIYDSLQVATWKRERQVTTPRRPIDFEGDQARAAFLDKFRGPKGSATEYQSGIPQALTLMNGQMIAAATEVETSHLLQALQAPFFSDEERIESLFLTVLSRPPSADERTRFVSHLESRITEAERREALGDMLWALLNTGEFMLNH